MRIVDGGVFEQRGKDEHETRDQVDVDGLHIAYARQWRAHARAYRGHGEHRRDAESDTRRRRLVVYPERYPREHDDENRRQVRLKDEIADVSFEQEAQRQTCVLTFIIDIFYLSFI